MKKYSSILLVLLVVFAAFVAAFLGEISTKLLSENPSLIPAELFIARQSKSNQDNLQAWSKTLQAQESSGMTQVYDANYVLVGQAFVATNDGWLISVQSDNVADSKFVWIKAESGELLAIEQIIADPYTNLVFLHVDSQALRPVTLAFTANLQTLNQYLTLGYRSALTLTSALGSTTNQAAYLAADLKNTYYAFDKGNLGDLVYNNSAEAIALIVKKDDGAQAIGVEYLRNSLEQVLKYKKITQGSLGIYYLDLAQQTIPSTISQNNLKGALLTNQWLLPPAVVLPLSSAAYQGGLRLQDIIISVNGTVLDQNYTLSEALASTKPQDQLELGVLRQGQAISLSIVLK